MLGAAILGGTIAASAGMQWLNSEKARKANKAELERMEGIVNALQNPSFNTADLTPEDYRLAQKFVPEIASYIEETAPQVVRGESEGATRGLEAQMAALQKFRNLSDTGDDTQSQLLREKALRAAQVQNQGQQAAIQQNFAQRGIAGSPMEYVAALMGQQGAGQDATLASQDAAMDAYGRRLQAMKDSASLGGQIRDTELDVEAKNAAIINGYNERAARNRNVYNRYAADTMNDGQRFNIGAMQDVMNKNTAQRNLYQRSNRDYRNEMGQQDFQNQMNKASLATGQGQAAMQNNMQNARDVNQAIAGVAQGAATMGQMYGDSKERAADRELREKELQYKYGR
jgi:hypothetical protein